MARWIIAISVLLLSVDQAAAQNPTDQRTSEETARTPAHVDERLVPRREAVDAALGDLDAAQKFDWLRRKRNEIQTLRSRQAAALAEVDGQVERARRDYDVQLDERDRLRFDLSEAKERDALEEQITQLKEEVDQYADDNKLERLDMLEEQYSYYDNSTNAQEIENRMVQLEEDIRKTKIPLDNAMAHRQELIRVMDDTAIYMDGLEDEMGLLLIPESEKNLFKLWMTAAFSGLVLVVILGFFVLSWQDQTVRRAIFSSQSGIQFLTLFSLVIAIILFGILEILEGKELAALLGGLSGYILGRVTSGEGGGASHPPPGSHETDPTPPSDEAKRRGAVAAANP